MENEFKNNSIYVTALSLANIVFVAACFRNFFHYPFWKKSAISISTFFGSHWSGMYKIKKDSEEMCDKFINKYK